MIQKSYQALQQLSSSINLNKTISNKRRPAELQSNHTHFNKTKRVGKYLQVSQGPVSNLAPAHAQAPVVVRDQSGTMHPVPAKPFANRDANTRIFVGLKQDEVKTTSNEEILSRLLGPWDSVSKKFSKMDAMMSLMESGIKLGGGPVVGPNWKTRIHEIAADLTHKFGGKPAESTVHVVCLCLFQVQNHLRSIIHEDPGIDAIAGDSRLEKAACHEKFFLRLIEFCHQGNQEIHKQMAAARARRTKSYVYPTGSTAEFPHTKDNIRKSPKLANITTRTVPATVSTTAACSAVNHIGPEAARLLIKLSESIIEKNQMEIIIMKRKEKEYKFDLRMKKIGFLEKKVSAMDKSDPLYSCYQDKIRELIKGL